MCIQDNDSMRRRTYLILLRDGVVVQDLTETLLERDPQAQVLSAPDEAAAIALLSGRPALLAAFVAGHPDAFEGSDLRRAIEGCGGRAVLLGNAAERVGRGPGWVALRQPFFPEMVAALLADLQGTE